MIPGPNAAYAENETSEQSSTRNDRPQAYSFIVVSMYLCQLKEYVLEDVNHWALAQYNVIQPGDAGFRDGLRWSMAVRTKMDPGTGRPKYR